MDHLGRRKRCSSRYGSDRFRSCVLNPALPAELLARLWVSTTRGCPRGQGPTLHVRMLVPYRYWPNTRGRKASIKPAASWSSLRSPTAILRNNIAPSAGSSAPTVRRSIRLYRRCVYAQIGRFGSVLDRLRNNQNFSIAFSDDLAVAQIDEGRRRILPVLKFVQEFREFFDVQAVVVRCSSPGIRSSICMIEA